MATQSVLCVEGNGFREAGELISIELTFISGKYLHIKMRNLSPRAVEGRKKDYMFDTISVTARAVTLSALLFMMCCRAVIP